MFVFALIVDHAKFLTHLLRSNFIRRNVLAWSTISANTNINQESYNNILVPLPCLPEQKQITSILSNIGDQISQQQSHLSNLKTMRKSILNSKLTKEETIVAN
jgi:restriction endonuclease S subunit